jgi:hypothetical protein
MLTIVVAIYAVAAAVGSILCFHQAAFGERSEFLEQPWVLVGKGLDGMFALLVIMVVFRRTQRTKPKSQKIAWPKLFRKRVDIYRHYCGNNADSESYPN